MVGFTTVQRLAFAYAHLLSWNNEIMSLMAIEYVGLVPCPTTPGLQGYTNTSLLNIDIQKDVIAYAAGIVKSSYFYALCPDTLFEINSSTDQPIVPLLSNSIFSCGPLGAVQDNCVLSGGGYHFLAVESFPLEDVVVRGLTFEGVTGTSIYGNAHPSSSMYFRDCIWRNNVGISTVYLWFQSSEGSGRRLSADNTPAPDVDKILTELASTKMVQPSAQEENERELNVRYSMVLSFNNCIFKNNTEDIATIFNVGGVVILSSTTFESNTIDRFGVFSSVLGGHAYVLDDSSFMNNFAPFGPVFVDSQSFLQYSAGNSGQNNTGNVCEGLFLEEEGSTCYVAGTRCTGDCCEFGDDSCDLYTDRPTNAPTASPTTSSPTASPTARITSSPVVNTIDIPAVATTSRPTTSPTKGPTSTPTKRPTSVPTKSPTVVPLYESNSEIDPEEELPTTSPTTSPIAVLLESSIVKEIEEIVEKKDFNLVLSIGVPIVVATLLLGLWLIKIRRGKKRMEVIRETQMAESAEASSGKDLGDIVEDLSPVT